ncbi:MAG: cysteine hydrolase family protein [Pseudomonadota bacterium]
MTQTALVLIDIQNDYFDGGRKPLEGMRAAAANATRLLEHFRQHSLPVIHIRHIARSSEAPFFRPDTLGSEIHRTVQPRENEAVFEKTRPNAFVGTPLEKALLDAEVDHVTLCGAMSQMCVDATARAAADIGFGVTVVEDSCAAAAVTFGAVSVPSTQVHAAIMAPLAASYGIVMSTDECLGSIASP